MSFQKEKGEISLKELLINIGAFWFYLLSRWRFIILFVLMGGLLGLLYALISVPVYKASTSFILESSKKSNGSYAGIAEKLGLSMAMGSSSDIFRDDDNLITFMKSRRLISQTLYSTIPNSENNELLIERFLTINDLRNEWRKYPRLSNIVFSKNLSTRSVLEDSLVTYIHENLFEGAVSISKPDKDKDLIHLSTSSVDEAFAKAFNERLMENISEFYAELQTQKAKENVSILQRQVDSVRSLLNSALSGVASSTDANPNLNPAFQRVKVTSQKKLVDVELNKAILIELVKNLEMAKINLRQATPLVLIIDHPVLPLKKKELKWMKGFVVGGFLLGLLSVIYFALKYYLRKILYETPSSRA